MEEKKQKGQEVPCSLLGNKICPKPHECDGINRMCTLWQQHSGK